MKNASLSYDVVSFILAFLPIFHFFYLLQNKYSYHMRTHKYCPHCYRELKKSSLKELGYTFDCPWCEEDFFRFEVLNKRLVKTMRCRQQ